MKIKDIKISEFVIKDNTPYPPVPEAGKVKLTKKPGWGYGFDWEYFDKKRIRGFLVKEIIDEGRHR